MIRAHPTDSACSRFASTHAALDRSCPVIRPGEFTRGLVFAQDAQKCRGWPHLSPRPLAHRRKLRPVDRIKPFVLGTDRHRAFQRSDDFAPIRQTRLVRDSRQRMALWTGLVPLSAVASFRRRETSLGNCDDVRLVEAPAVALTFKNPRGQSRLPCAGGASVEWAPPS